MNERLTFTQRAALAGKDEEQRARIEEESSLWMVQCQVCGFEASVWDHGGVRSGARGAKTRRQRCAECGKRGVHAVYWSGSDAQSGAASRGTVDDAGEQPSGSPLREAGRVDRASPPVRPPAPPRPGGPLPVWLVLLLLMGIGFFANELWGVAIPLWILVVIGFALRSARGQTRVEPSQEPSLTATFTGVGCLLVLGLVLLGWILSLGLYGSFAR